MYRRLDYAIFVKSDTIIVTVYWKLLFEEVQLHFLAIYTSSFLVSPRQPNIDDDNINSRVVEGIYEIIIIISLPQDSTEWCILQPKLEPQILPSRQHSTQF